MGRVVFVLCDGSMATARRPQSQRICIVSLQHFGGRSRDHRLGAGCAGTLRTGPAGAPGSPGRPWVPLDYGLENNCIWQVTGPVSPVPVCGDWKIKFGPAVPVVGASGPGRHWQMLSCLCQVCSGVGSHRLWMLRGQSRGPQGQGGEQEHGRGLRGGSVGAPRLSLPALPHQCRTHAPRSHFPMPERGLACSGGIPSLLSPGSSMLGKVLEPQGDRSLLSPPYRDSPPGPAESGRRKDRKSVV